MSHNKPPRHSREQCSRWGKKGRLRVVFRDGIIQPADIRYWRKRVGFREIIDNIPNDPVRVINAYARAMEAKRAKRRLRPEQIRDGLLWEISPEDWRQMVRACVDRAKGGDEGCLKLLLEYTVGKPVQGVALAAKVQSQQQLTPEEEAVIQALIPGFALPPSGPVDGQKEGEPDEQACRIPTPEPEPGIIDECG